MSGLRKSSEPMNPDKLEKALQTVADFYDQRKVGHIGSMGFRRSSDLGRVKGAIAQLIARSLLIPQKCLFLDMGCADGRVNVLMSYLTAKSIGIELNEWIMDEYVPVKTELEDALKTAQLPLPPDNISLFLGDSLDDEIHEAIKNRTGTGFEEFDLFYTYLSMYEEFSELIAQKAKKGAIFMVYGLDKVLPKNNGLELLTPQKPLEGIIALYRKA
jgi:hypothetical protein